MHCAFVLNTLRIISS